MRTIEDLEQEFDQANSSEEEKILDKVNQLQLQCNIERSTEVVPDSAESAIGPLEVNPNPQNTTQRDIASSDEEEASRYRYRHEPTRTRRIGGRHLFSHPGHAYPLTNAGVVLNIDCVTNTDEIMKEWVKSLLIYSGVTRTEGNDLKTFIPLTLGGKVYEWF